LSPASTALPLLAAGERAREVSAGARCGSDARRACLWHTGAFIPMRRDVKAEETLA